MKKYMFCAALILALTGLTGCQKEEVVPKLLEPVGVEMDTAVAQIGDMYSMSLYNGEIVPYVEEVQFAVDGQLKEFKVAAGDTVEAGQVLAKLDDEELWEDIEKLEAEIEDILTMGTFSDRSMVADIEIAKEQLEVLQERKAGDESIKAQELEIQLLELELEEEQELRSLEVSRLNKQVQELRNELVNTELTAPLSGKVVYVSQAAAGDHIKSDTTVICIADETRLTISSEYIAPSVIKSAYKITAQILDTDYEVTYEPLSDSEYVTLVLSGESVNSKFSLTDENAEIECGQYVSVKIWNVYKENVLTVPANALHRDEKGRYVYKIVDGQRVRCNVEVGIVNNIEAEILDGIQEGDVVYVKE